MTESSLLRGFDGTSLCPSGPATARLRSLYDCRRTD